MFPFFWFDGFSFLFDPIVGYYCVSSGLSTCIGFQFPDDLRIDFKFDKFDLLGRIESLKREPLFY